MHGPLIAARRAATNPASVVLLALLIVLTAFPARASSSIGLDIDATDVVRGIQHARLTIPARPGPMTLAYPKWIPGEHRPNGPITQLMNLHISAAGRPLFWRRDSRDAFLFHIDVPAGARAVEVRLDYFSPARPFGPGFGNSPNSTAHLVIVLFNQLLLYPADAAADAVDVAAKVRIPSGWTFDSALAPQHTDDGEIVLPVVSLSMLVDSPLLAGEHFRSIPLTANTRISLAGEAMGDLAVDHTVLSGLRNLVPEAAAVFGPAHYRRYVWLVSLGDTLAHDGLEHHESSDVRDTDRFFTDPASRIDWVLFPHEYVHSWNGKYRRPVGLATRNYQQPMLSDMLWLYEGLTRYYGDFVLAARSGLLAPEQARAYLAYVAAQMDEDRPGRDWRSLGDTATAVPAFADAPAAWTTVRRGADYYNEMLLVWLEADTAIRRRSNDKRTLDDFCRMFFSGPGPMPSVKPYERSEVIKDLHAVEPSDWNDFLSERIDAIDPKAPLDGVRNGGWTLVYDDNPNPFFQAVDTRTSSYNLSLSLGLWVKPDGSVLDVVGGSPAFVEGVAPGMRLIAIDGREWSIRNARDAIVGAEHAAKPIELRVAFGDVTREVRLNYHGGLRYPHLRRDRTRPDLLAAILAPRASR
jgi:predicted metalloprotease with PDZ domain